MKDRLLYICGKATHTVVLNSKVKLFNPRNNLHRLYLIRPGTPANSLNSPTTPSGMAYLDLVNKPVLELIDHVTDNAILVAEGYYKINDKEHAKVVNLKDPTGFQNEFDKQLDMFFRIIQ